MFLMVVAGDAPHVERMLEEKVDVYFHPGIVTMRLHEDLIDEATSWKMIDLIPSAIHRSSTSCVLGEVLFLRT
jgi:hypothetical protein